MTIQNDQRGLLYRKGNFIKMLKPGSHFTLPGDQVEVHLLTARFNPSKDLKIYETDPELMMELVISEVADYEAVLHYEDSQFKEVLLPGRYAYWKALREHRFVRIDLRNPEIDPSLDKSLFLKDPVLALTVSFAVESWEKGLLFLDKTFKTVLEPGNYFFWKGPVSVNILKADQRQLQVEITGQEIMTKDKVLLRINFFAHYKITDIMKVAVGIKEYEQQLYLLLQQVIRELIGSQMLDELLLKKEEISTYIVTHIREKCSEIGIEVTGGGIKDIVLPGEIKDILNQVLIAEKKAQANIITRREETASTRSLLNTAKLMEENAVLYRLKELEFLEKISDKISQISLTSGLEVIEQLRKTFVPEKK